MHLPMLLVLVIVLCLAVADARTRLDRNTAKPCTRVSHKPAAALSIHQLSKRGLGERNLLHLRGGASGTCCSQHNMLQRSLLCTASPS
jgi:hypothetical protein